MVRLPLFVSALLVGRTLSFCDYGTGSFPREPSVPVGKFGYRGMNGPLNWLGLNESANALCASGLNQSPINLNSSGFTRQGSTLNLTIPSYPQGAVFENLGVTVEVVVNGTLDDQGLLYNLAQFHFHTPSEHSVDLKYFPIEIHFVLSAPGGLSAVLMFFVDFGDTDPLLASILPSLGGIPTPGNATLTRPLDFTALQGHVTSNNLFTYTGSLTTPPCTEGVSWYINSEPLSINTNDYRALRDVVKFNSRYTQNNVGGVNLLQNAATELKGA